MIHEKIINLKGEIVAFASHVQQMIERCIKGLIENDVNLLNQVIEEEEIKANMKEIEIDEMCMTIIAQYSPKAYDLRVVMMILKMNNDLERMADHSVNIAESSLFLINRYEISRSKTMIISVMEKEVVRMLNDSLTALINEEKNIAKEVCRSDDIVDNLLKNIIEELVRKMIENPEYIKSSIELLNIAYNLERIADLSTNIAEDVIYMINGKVIKHNI